MTILRISHLAEHDAPMTVSSVNPFDSSAILDGIRRWVEIETPTEAPD